MLTFKLADMKKMREKKTNIGGRYMIEIPKNRKWVVTCEDITLEKCCGGVTESSNIANSISEVQLFI